MFLIVQSGLETMLVSLVDDFCKSYFVKQGRSISTLLGTYVGGRKVSTLLVLRLGTEYLLMGGRRGGSIREAWWLNKGVVVAQ
jgi:hypothetical protein